MNTAELIKAINEEHGIPVETENCWECTYGTHNGEVVEKLRRLAELEDKLESGLLGELPCKVGDTVYYVDENIAEFGKVREYVVQEILFSRSNIQFWFGDGIFVYDSLFGDCCFLDKAQAEARLKELQEKGQ